MGAITRVDLAALREVVPPADVFICSSSFEPRCRSIPEKLDTAGLRRALIVENKDLSVHVGKNAEWLREKFGAAAVDVPANTRSPLLTADSLRGAIEQVESKEPLRFVVDITTFTHESLLILLRLLFLLAKPSDSFTLCYCSAKEYAASLPTEEKWLSKGCGEVRSVLGYAGEVLPSRLTHLIILVGYEYERASKLIEAFEPHCISLGYGKAASSVSDKHHAANRHFHKLVEETASRYPDHYSFEFSCNDPWEAKAAVLEVASRCPGYNVVVAPLNTKISSVGCALAAVENDAIQLCYAPALHYNYAEYSVAGSSVYVLELPEFAKGCAT